MRDEWTDDTFRALADTTRRKLLIRLLDYHADDIISIPVVMESVVDDPSEHEIDLYHKHLPLLEKLGLVIMDRSSRMLMRGDNFEDIASLLKFLRDKDSDRPPGLP